MANVRISRFAAEFAGKKHLLPVLERGPLPELVQFFMHNWGVAPRVRNLWSTDVVTALSGAEERRGLCDRPYRSFLWRFTGLSSDESGALWSLMQRAHKQRLVTPVYSDPARLTAAASAGASALSCPTAGRRFYAGCRVVVITPTRRGRVGQAEVAAVDQVLASQLLLEDQLALDHPAYARVYPLAEVELLLESSSRIPAPHLQDVVMDLSEISGASALPPWSPPGALPDAQTYRQVPIFPFRPEWATDVTVSLRRLGDRFPLGRAVVTSVNGDRPLVGFRFDLVSTTRESALAYLEWLDSRQGRLRKFWLTDPRAMMELGGAGVTATYADVVLSSTAADVDRFISAVTIRTSDGSSHVRAVRSTSQEAGGVTRLAFEEPLLLPDYEDVQTVRHAYLSRHARDDYEERWESGRILRVTVETTSLPEERDVIAARRIDPVPLVASISFIPDLHVAMLSPVGLFQPGGAAASMDGQEVGAWIGTFGTQAQGAATAVPPDEAYHTRQTMGALVNVRAGDFTAAGALKARMRSIQASPWYSNAKGMTVFLVAQRHDAVAHDESDDYLLRYTDAAGAVPDLLHWRRTSIELREDPGVSEPDFQVAHEDVLYPAAQFHIAVLWWQPGSPARVYRDGQILGQTPRGPIDLPVGSTDAARRAELFRIANEEMSGMAPAATDTALNAVLVWRRALHMDELDIVGRFLAERVGTTWQRVVT